LYRGSFARRESQRDGVHQLRAFAVACAESGACWTRSATCAAPRRSDILKSCLIGRTSIKKVFGESQCKNRIKPVIDRRLTGLRSYNNATTPRGVPIVPILAVLENIHGHAPAARIYLAG
jgi:hypothetical protein